MVETKVSAGGGVLFWTLAQWYDRLAIVHGLEGIGRATLAPPPRPIVSCARAALGALYKGNNFTIKPLKDPDKGAHSLEVVRIDPVDDERNDYVQVLRLKIDTDDNEQPRIRLWPFDPTIAQSITDEFNNARGLVGGEAVSDMLTKWASLLRGTRLRPVGGIYWLPNDQLDAWSQVTAIAESTATRGRCSCYILRNLMDAEAVRAVKDAIEVEVQGRAREIWDEISAGTLGKRGLNNRSDEANDLISKVLEYENLLSTSLVATKDGLENLRNAAAAAALMASAPETVEA
jgi:hypothetical protein